MTNQVGILFKSIVQIFQGIALLALHYILHAWLVLWAKCRRSTSDGNTLPFLYKLSWGLENMVSTISLFVTVLYWTLLHPYFMEHWSLETPLDEFMNFFAHALNTISYLVDFLISGRPRRIHHFYFGIIFGLGYGVFFFHLLGGRRDMLVSSQVFE